MRSPPGTTTGVRKSETWSAPPNDSETCVRSGHDHQAVAGRPDPEDAARALRRRSARGDAGVGGQPAGAGKRRWVPGHRTMVVPRDVSTTTGTISMVGGCGVLGAG